MIKETLATDTKLLQTPPDDTVVAGRVVCRTIILSGVAGAEFGATFEATSSLHGGGLATTSV